MNIDIINGDKELFFDNETINLNFKICKNSTIKLNIKNNCNLFLYNELDLCNIYINIDIEKNSVLKINEFNLCKNCNITTNINFLGEHIDLYYNSSNVGDLNKSIIVNHDHNNTNSYLDIRGVNNNNNMKFSIIESVLENIKNCDLNENSKIININNSKSFIEPILLIKSNEVNASHSSIIRNIDEDYTLYLKSRGLSESDSIKLIKDGFLFDFLNKNQKDFIKESNYEY